MTALHRALHDLARGGIAIVTRLDDGTIGAHLTIQLDGDAINRVSPRFLTDAGAQQRHARALGDFLAHWKRARWLAGQTVTVLSFGASASLLAVHPTWQTLGVSTVAPLAIRWLARLASHQAIASLLRRAVR